MVMFVRICQLKNGLPINMCVVKYAVTGPVALVKLWVSKDHDVMVRLVFGLPFGCFLPKWQDFAINATLLHQAGSASFLQLVL